MLTRPGTAIPNMKLIGSYASPFVRGARIVLAEKRIEHEFVVDNPRMRARACPISTRSGLFKRPPFEATEPRDPPVA